MKHHVLFQITEQVQFEGNLVTFRSETSASTLHIYHEHIVEDANGPLYFVKTIIDDEGVDAEGRKFDSNRVIYLFPMFVHLVHQGKKMFLHDDRDEYRFVDSNADQDIFLPVDGGYIGDRLFVLIGTKLFYPHDTAVKRYTGDDNEGPIRATKVLHPLFARFDTQNDSLAMSQIESLSRPGKLVQFSVPKSELILGESALYAPLLGHYEGPVFRLFESQELVGTERLFPVRMVKVHLIVDRNQVLLITNQERQVQVGISLDDADKDSWTEAEAITLNGFTQVVINKRLYIPREDQVKEMTPEITSTPEEFMQSETGARRTKDTDGFAYTLMHPVFMQRVAAVWARGAGRYGRHNWELGFDGHVCAEHLLQHYYKWVQGDSNEDHLAHMACNLIMMIVFSETRPECFDTLRWNLDGSPSPAMRDEIHAFHQEREKQKEARRHHDRGLDKDRQNMVHQLQNMSHDELVNLAMQLKDEEVARCRGMENPRTEG